MNQQKVMNKVPISSSSMRTWSGTSGINGAGVSPICQGEMSVSHMGVSENSVPLNPMVLLIIIPMKNGYFIGNINPTFQLPTHMLEPPESRTIAFCMSAGATEARDSSL